MNLENTIIKNFTLKNQDSKEVSINQLKGKKVVIFFYPKDNTPGCTLEAQGFRDLKDEFNAINTVILGISKDGSNSHCNFIEKHSLNYDLLSDPDYVVAKLLEAYYENSLVFKLKRSSLIIDEDGLIIKHYEKASGSIAHSKEVLTFIKNYQK